MATKGVNVTITGQTALLMHSFPMAPIEAVEKKTPEEQAELATYRDPAGALYVPGINIQRALIAGATYSKGKGRGSLQKSAAACIRISPERVPLDAPPDFAIDSRPVVVPATKGRVIRHRPRFDKWALSFEIEYEDVLLTEAQMRRIVDDTGQRVGLLDFRPEKKGPFGRFSVTRWA